MTIKVLIVDASPQTRTLLSEIIDRESDMEVVATAPDPLVARQLIKDFNPDVLTLDVETPRMNGLDFLGKLMHLRPMPVVMVSSLAEQGSEIALRALELGAVDFVTKPRLSERCDMPAYANLLAEKIRVAFQAKSRIQHRNRSNQRRIASQPARQAATPARRSLGCEKLIVIGASTGGTEAIKDFLIQMPPDCPGILIAQHMSEGFTASFARRLNSLCKIRVVEALGGERILPGHAYVAPGHSHLMLARSGASYITQIDSCEPVNRHRPSVDVLFHSTAIHAGRNAVGVIMTGMGKDGAAGMLAMRDAGAHNFAQDESSCVVFGMPKEAIAVGAVHEVGPIQQLASMVLGHLARPGDDAAPD